MEPLEVAPGDRIVDARQESGAHVPLLRIKEREDFGEGNARDKEGLHHCREHPCDRRCRRRIHLAEAVEHGLDELRRGDGGGHSVAEA